MTGGNSHGGRAPSIQQQADLIWSIVQRCRMRDGSIAGETWMRLAREDVDMLEGLRLRLERMVPFEADIRRIVTGGGRR